MAVKSAFTAVFVAGCVVLACALGQVAPAAGTEKVAARAALERALQRLGSSFQTDRDQGLATIEAMKPLPAGRLVKAMGSDNVYVRQNCSDLLLRLAKPSRIDAEMSQALSRNLDVKEDATVCIRVATLLTKTGARGAIPSALQYFRARGSGAADKPVRIALIRLMGVGGKAAVPFLKKTVVASKSRALRHEATLSLIRLREPGYESLLIARIDTERSPHEKVFLIASLASTGAASAFPVAAVYASDPSATVRAGACDVLETLRSEDAARLLAGKVAGTYSVAERERIAARLRRLGLPAIQLLRDQWLRADTAEALRLLRGAACFPVEQAAPLLIEMMASSNRKGIEQGARPLRFLAYQVQLKLRTLSGNHFDRSLYELDAKEAAKLIKKWEKWARGALRKPPSGKALAPPSTAVATIHKEAKVDRKVLLIAKLAAKKSPGAFVAAAVCAEDASVAVRKAAYEALANLSTDRAVRLLAAKAITASSASERERLQNHLLKTGQRGIAVLRGQWRRLRFEPPAVLSAQLAESSRMEPRVITALARFPWKIAAPLLIEIMEHHGLRKKGLGPEQMRIERAIAFQAQQALRSLSGKRFGPNLHNARPTQTRTTVAAWKAWSAGEKGKENKK